MLASIHPLGERARHNRWGFTATSYVVASAAGGVTIGAAAGLLGAAVERMAHPSDAIVSAIAAAGSAAALLADLRLLALPSIRRQVRKEWIDELRGWVYGAGFGFQLGLGLVTIVTTATIYLTVIFAVLSGSLVRGVAIGLVFGVARSLPLLAVARVHDGPSLRAVHTSMQRLAGLSRAAAIAVVAAVLGLATLGAVNG